MAQVSRHAMVLVAAFAASAASASVGALPEGASWQVAARSFSLAPGSFALEDWSSRGGLGGRALDAAVVHASGIGVSVDGELWRMRSSGDAQSLATGDAALSVRVLAHGPHALDFLAGVRMDAALAPGTAALDAWTAPMAGARATLGIADGVLATLGAGASADRSLGASWRVSAGLRVELADGWSFVADLRWSSDALAVPGAAAADGLGRASAWAGLALPF